MRELGARHVEQQAPVAAFGELARRNVLLPRPVRHDQRHLGMRAQDLDRVIGAGIVIGDDRIDMPGE